MQSAKQIIAALANESQSLLYEFTVELGKLAGAGRRFWWIIDVFAAAFGIFIGLITEYVWSPPITYAVVIALVALDALTGSLVAIKYKRFETRKSARLVYKVVAYTLLLAISHNLGKHESSLFWLPYAVIFPICTILLLSAVKNASLLGYIDARIAERIYNTIDSYKNPKLDDDNATRGGIRNEQDASETNT